MSDEIRLQHLGYKQELSRTLTRLTNYGMTLSAVGISTAITSLFGYGLITGGPVVMVWGWVAVSFFALCIALGLAEICSAFPTSGGLYYWTANLVPEQYKAAISWFTGWFNLLNQFAALTAADFGLAMLVGSVISIGVGQWSPHAWHLILIHLGLLISHGICNSLGSRFLVILTHISTWWQLFAPIIVSIALLATGRGSHRSAHFTFTTYVNHTGWTSMVSMNIDVRNVVNLNLILLSGLRYFNRSSSGSILFGQL